jgi:thiamine-monophosphate kinase
MGEFDLIERFFTRAPRRAAVGVGDDCALWPPLRPNMQLAVSSDMLVEGRHFLSTVDPARLGHKALAVNLSDLAACGATPLGFSLALALPRLEPAWLQAFADGLLALADSHGCELIGGDTTQGPLTLCITVLGEVPLADGRSQALLRSGAQVGDDIYVSGSLGDARLALEQFRGRHSLPAAVFDHARLRMEAPTPRVALGQALRGVATAAIDISDGLLGDLGHVLKASGVGARIEAELALPLLASAHLAAIAADQPGWPLAPALQLEYVLAGGDDYELAFTAPAAAQAQVLVAARASGTPVTRIGRIVDAAQGVQVVNGQGRPVPGRFASFDHFSTAG